SRSTAGTGVSGALAPCSSRVVAGSRPRRYGSSRAASRGLRTRGAPDTTSPTPTTNPRLTSSARGAITGAPVPRSGGGRWPASRVDLLPALKGGDARPGSSRPGQGGSGFVGHFRARARSYMASTGSNGESLRQDVLRRVQVAVVMRPASGADPGADLEGLWAGAAPARRAELRPRE